MEKKRKFNLLPADILSYCILFLLMPFLSIPNTFHEFSTQKHLVFVLFFLVMLVVYAFKTKEIKINFSIAHVFIVLFSLGTLLSLISVFTTNIHYFPSSLDPALYVVVIAISSFIFTTRFGKDYNYIEKAFFFFLISGFIVAFDGLLNAFTGWDILFGYQGDPSQRLTLRATIGNPNFVADYLAQLIPVSVYFALRKKSSIFTRIFSIITFFMMYWVTLLAQTRIIFVAIFVGLAIAVAALMLSKKDEPAKAYLKTKQFLFPLLAIVFSFIFLIVMFNIESPFNKKGAVIASQRFSVSSAVTSFDERELSWSGSIEQFKDVNNPLNKIIGGGINTYPVYFGEYLVAPQQKNPEKFLYAWNNFKITHNDYLEALGETGLIGFLSIIGIVISLFVVFVKIIRNQKDSNKMFLISMLAWSITIMALHAFTEFAFHMHPNLLLSVFICSVFVSGQFTNIKEITVNKKMLLFVPLIAVTAASAYYKINYSIAEYYFMSGSESNSYKEQYVQYYLNIPQMVKQLDENIAAMKKQITAYAPGSEQFGMIQNNLLQAEAKRNEITSSTKEIYDKGFEYYKKAKDELIKCLDYFSGFGKAKFYLAQLMGDRIYREKEINYANLEDSFNMNLPEFRHVIANYTGSLSLMPFPERKLREDISKLYDKNADEKVKEILLSIQLKYDMLSMFKSSITSFSEKNTPRVMARTYFVIIEEYANLKILINNKLMDAKYLDEIIKLQKNAYNNYNYWYNLGVVMLPGGWNRFPEWKDVYSEYFYRTRYLITFGFDKKDVTSKLMNMVEKDGFASYYMAKKTIGIPDESLKSHIEYLTVLKNDQGLKNEFIKSVVKSYKDVYNFYTVNKGKYQSDEILKKRIDDFIKYYEIFSNLK